MKKIFAVVMALTIVLSLGAFAVSADFVSSPGHKPGDGDSDIIITHYDDVHNADPRVDTDSFHVAVDELKDSAKDGSLDDLNDDIKDGAVVRDVYDITFVDEALDELENNGKHDVTLDTKFDNDNYQVIVRTDNGWVVIPSTRNADGTVTVTLTANSVVAILSYTPAPQGPTSQPTGDGIAAIVACLVVVGVAGSAVLLRRKNLEK